MKHRRWRRESTGYGDYVDEHNALYDAWEAAEVRVKEQERRNSNLAEAGNEHYRFWQASEKRVKELEAECEEHRRHVATLMSREAEVRRELREAEAALATEREAAKLTVPADIHASVCRKYDRLAARVKELESRSAVPPGVPGVEEFYKIYTDTCKSSTRNDDWPHGRRKAAITAVRDAILAALPVLTLEEVEKRHLEHRGFSLSMAAPGTFTGWLASRLPARLEPVPVTEEEIKAALQTVDDGDSVVTVQREAAAVMSLLREKQVVEEPEPIATAETTTSTLHETPLELVLDGDRLKLKDGRIELSKAPNNHTWVVGADIDTDSAARAGRWLLSFAGASVPDAAPIATAETLEQLAEIAAEEWSGDGYPYRSWAEGTKRRWRNAITAILRAARPEIDLCSASTWRSGESVLHAADVPSLNPYIRYRVELPPDDLFSRDEIRERQIALYQQWLLAYAHRGWVPKGAHEQALNAALSLPEYMAELNAALDAKGGE